MRFYVGVTDFDWYSFLSAQQPDEVNFWQPSARRFGVLEENAPFIFKLKSPHNAIAGGAFFVRYVSLPLKLAWDAFQEKNGTNNYRSFEGKILGYRTRHQSADVRGEVGCIILTDPFFFPEPLWIPQPKSWSNNIVSGKSYDTAERDGAALWEQIEHNLRLVEHWHGDSDAEVLVREKPRFGREYLARPRLGQGGFRAVLIDVYNRSCSVTGEKTLPALEAAHIKPYTESGPHTINNGMLLRADVHRLFDDGYLTVNQDYRLEVSPRIREEFSNGRDYYRLNGNRILLPHEEKNWPSPEYLRWHNDNRYLS